MVFWLVFVTLMLGLNGALSSRMDCKCPEDNALITTLNGSWLTDIADWRTCGKNVGLVWNNFYNLTFLFEFLGKHCTENSKCNFWVYNKVQKRCLLDMGTSPKYTPNRPDLVSGERGCQ